MAEANGTGASIDPNASMYAQNSSQSESQSQPKLATLPPSMSADDGLGRRPRDSRLLHTVLANLGVTAYQERVPLQLMDFAYRYTSSTLQDALHLTSEGYGAQTSGTGKNASNNDMSAVSLSSLRLSITSRTHYQFSPTLGKDFYQGIAQERNQVQLPAIGRDFGVRLPPEQYCLTGIAWKLKDEWNLASQQGVGGDDDLDQAMTDREVDQDEDGVEDGNERMEDFFGENVNGNVGDQGINEG
ncbi:MAG: hypothetical protein Q9166_003060 [cf. Caloplaca sp. 2 TL-2023]